MSTPTRPHYLNPPVVEVACGVQFKGAEDWQTTHYGCFWKLISDEYSEFQDQPPLPPLSMQPAVPPSPRVYSMPPMRRVFFIRPPGNYLVQLQPDRLLHNWRQVKPDDEYPRYERAFERFVTAWGTFREFLRATKLQPVSAEIFELTYVNHVLTDGSQFPRDIWNFLAFYRQTPQANHAEESSSIAMQFLWPLPDDMGTLSLDVKHGVRTNDDRAVLSIELNARGRANESKCAMETWFEQAHQSIVTTFDGFTTPQAHEQWRKQE